MIPFRTAMLSLFGLAIAGVVYGAAHANFFDDSYTGHLVVDGQVSNVPVVVRLTSDKYTPKPRLFINVQADADQLGFKDSYRYFANNKYVSCQIDDFGNWPGDKYYLNMRSTGIPACTQAVIEQHGFGGMTLKVNQGKAGAFDVVLEREYRQNPIVTAYQYFQYLRGGFASL